MPDTIRLPNARNFRSIGPMHNRHSQLLSDGHLYRSGDLSALQPDEQAQLARAGISLVIDLRSRYECQRRPNRLPADMPMEIFHGDIHVDVRAANGSLGDLLRADPSVEGVQAMMHATYDNLPCALLPRLRPIVEKMISTSGATLILCTAGKDRTGTLTASLLRMLEIPGTTILADYLATNDRIDLEAMAHTSGQLMQELFDVQLPRPALDLVNTVHESYLAQARASIARDHGSFDGWLQAAGIDNDLLQALRRRYLR